MTVRAAVTADIPTLCVLGKQFFNASQYSAITQWDAFSFESTMRALLEQRVSGGVFVAESDGEVVGMAGFILAPFFFNLSTLIGQELFWYVAPGHRVGVPLLDLMELTAKSQGAVIFVMSALSGQRDQAVARLLTKRGYRAAEHSFIKGL